MYKNNCLMYVYIGINITVQDFFYVFFTLHLKKNFCNIACAIFLYVQNTIRRERWIIDLE